ncbi:hypothetical protein MJN54_30135, partial [Salmonella enterica subsp. enterica serovar Kentucky]|nr:hypothetical protein [Salmonella enterica subsp. enterica serovar Kentucky]
LESKAKDTIEANKRFIVGHQLPENEFCWHGKLADTAGASDESSPTRVAMLTHLGHPDKVNASAAKFIAWRRETGQSPIASSQTFG